MSGLSEYERLTLGCLGQPGASSTLRQYMQALAMRPEISLERSSVRLLLGTFVEQGYVEETDGGYEMTPAGSAALSAPGEPSAGEPGPVTLALHPGIALTNTEAP